MTIPTSDKIIQEKPYNNVWHLVTAVQVHINSIVKKPHTQERAACAEPGHQTVLMPSLTVVSTFPRNVAS